MNKTSPVVPALIGGGVFGFVAALPVLGALNCCCCLLVVAAGFVAAWLHSRNATRQGGSYGPGDGALTGLLAGAFYAAVNAVFSALTFFVFKGGEPFEQALEGLEGYPGMNPEAVDSARRFIESMGMTGLFLIGLLITVVTGLIFATVGGLIGGAVFKVAPPAAPAPPPSIWTGPDETPGGAVPPMPPA